ncbi:M20 metallopeptidase family protein [Microtetraspora glauca]|uniref:Amidohydrolase n=1 Tax=Microtetraspora glauca TaxID=1996 RepID=A0ABV3GUM1_MICGL
MRTLLPSEDLNAKILAEVARHTERTIEMRRHLHANPELGFEEHATSAYVAERCSALGLDVRRGVGGTGVIADLDSGRPGRTVLVRADMDALPISEVDDGRPYRSTVPGVMHACGHDGHTAIALSVAHVLHTLGDHWSGRVRMCFQPAEELDDGARRMIRDGVMEGIDRAVGLHLASLMPTGRLGLGPGLLLASLDTFHITITGTGGHAGAPDGAIDPVPITAEVILALRDLGRRARADGSVVTVAQVNGGAAPNIIPAEVALAGTIRTLDAEGRVALREMVEQTARDVAELHGATSTFSRGVGCPPLTNDPVVTSLVRDAFAGAFGPDRVLDVEPTTGSDDMALYLDKVPGCYYAVGAGSPDAVPHHHPAFDIDERSLAVGVESLTRATLALLA